jgi:hypothetical protein
MVDERERWQAEDRYMDKRRKDCRWNYGELIECTYIWTKKANKEGEIQKDVR